MTATHRASDDAGPTLPGLEPAVEAPDDERPHDAHREERPEPDRWTRELPLEEPAPGLAADFVNDVTQIYLNEIAQHLLLKPEEELSLARAMRDGDFEARQTLI